MTRKQKQFYNEMVKYKYNKDDAYCAVINSKCRNDYYNEFAEVVENYFNPNRKTFRIKFINQSSIEICQRIVKAETLKQAVEYIEQDEPFVSVGEILESEELPA